MPIGGVVTVGVLDAHNHHVLASARVTLAGGGADTELGTLHLATR
jgi:hypothetical protein